VQGSRDKSGNGQTTSERDGECIVFHSLACSNADEDQRERSDKLCQ